jgi:hypothetical protein
MQTIVVNSLAQLVEQHYDTEYECCWITVDEHSISMTYDDEVAVVLQFDSIDALAQTLMELLALELTEEFISMCMDVYDSSTVIQQLGEQYEMEM